VHENRAVFRGSLYLICSGLNWYDVPGILCSKFHTEEKTSDVGPSDQDIIGKDGPRKRKSYDDRIFGCYPKTPLDREESNCHENGLVQDIYRIGAFREVLEKSIGEIQQASSIGQQC